MSGRVREVNKEDSESSIATEDLKDFVDSVEDLLSVRISTSRPLNLTSSDASESLDQHVGDDHQQDDAPQSSPAKSHLNKSSSPKHPAPCSPGSRKRNSGRITLREKMAARVAEAEASSGVQDAKKDCDKPIARASPKLSRKEIKLREQVESVVDVLDPKYSWSELQEMYHDE